MNNDKDILLISVFTFLTVTTWIFFELIKTTKTLTTPKSSLEMLSTINPTFDLDTLNDLSKRIKFE